MQLTDLNLDYFSILPEIITALAGVILMLLDAFSKNGARQSGPLFSLFSLVAAGVAIAALWPRANSSSFAGMIVNDHLRLYFALVVVVCGIIAVMLASQFLNDEALPPGEFYALLMFATCGMLMMASAGDLVMVFLGLETSSIATYVMAGYRRTDLRANESSLKYFLLGSFSAAFLLYGMALTYGATGSTNIEIIRQVIVAGKVAYPQMLLVGGAMMLVGFGFKIATAPFHLWTPDVYEGAPTVVTAILATGPKVAVFAAFLRVFAEGFGTPNAPAVGGQLHDNWIASLAIMAAIGMTFGNIVALAQRNMKRMLAYSSIAHGGYTLIGFLTTEYAPVGFYMLTYALMSLGAFAIVQVLARRGDAKTEISDYAGIGFEVPNLSFPLAIFMLSMAGIPPTAGFMGKFYVFKSAWVSSPNLRWLVIVAIVNSIISVYYYLYPIVVMFFRPQAEGFVKPRINAMAQVALALTIIGTLYFGLFPNSALKILQQKAPSAQQIAIQR
jgi:NADH-quinone oxidoreductase subunit N